MIHKLNLKRRLKQANKQQEPDDQKYPSVDRHI